MLVASLSTAHYKGTDMRKTVTILLLTWILAPTALAQTVETVLVSPMITDYLALDTATGDLYSTNYQQISRIAPDGTIELLIDALDFVTGLGVSKDGDLYYAETRMGVIYKRAANGIVSVHASGLNDAIGIWMSPEDDGFYTQTYTGGIYFIGFDGAVQTIATGLAERMTDIVLDEAGTMYLAYFDFGRIDKMDPNGTPTEFATIPSWLSYITYANGYLYATGWQSHQLYRIDVATGEVELIAGTGDPGLADGQALTAAQFNVPNGLVPSVTGDTLYISDLRSNALRRVTSITTVALEEDTEAPEGFVLAQNYPNPFNPATAIPYTLRRPSQVTLTVTDLAGRNVATLVSEHQAPGTYSATWDAVGQPSGVYLYRLETESFTQTRRMILVK